MGIAETKCTTVDAWGYVGHVGLLGTQGILPDMGGLGARVLLDTHGAAGDTLICWCHAAILDASRTTGYTCGSWVARGTAGFALGNCGLHVVLPDTRRTAGLHVRLLGCTWSYRRCMALPSVSTIRCS